MNSLSFSQPGPKSPNMYSAEGPVIRNGALLSSPNNKIINNTYSNIGNQGPQQHSVHNPHYITSPQTPGTTGGGSGISATHV